MTAGLGDLPRKGVVSLRIDPILGLERQCFACGDWWPQDEEFWYFVRGKVAGRCRACWVDFNKTRRPA